VGWQQAIECGKALKNSVLTEGDSVHFVVSPYVRTMETFHGVLRAYADPGEIGLAEGEEEDERTNKWYKELEKKHNITFHEDPRIREQDYGNYQNEEEVSERSEAKRSEASERAFWKTKILAMTCAKWLQTATPTTKAKPPNSFGSLRLYRSSFKK